MSDTDNSSDKFINEIGFFPSVIHAFDMAALETNCIIILRPVNKKSIQFEKNGFFIASKIINDDGYYPIKWLPGFPKGIMTKDKSDLEGTIPGEVSLSKTALKIERLKIELEKQRQLIIDLKNEVDDSDLYKKIDKFKQLNIKTVEDAEKLYGKTETSLKNAEKNLIQATKKRLNLIRKGEHQFANVILGLTQTIKKLRDNNRKELADELEPLNDAFIDAIKRQKKPSELSIAYISEIFIRLQKKVFKNKKLIKQLINQDSSDKDKILDAFIELTTTEKLTTENHKAVLIADYDLFLVAPQNVTLKESRLLTHTVKKVNRGNISFIDELIAHSINYEVMELKDHPPCILHGSELGNPNPETIGLINFPLTDEDHIFHDIADVSASELEQIDVKNQIKKTTLLERGTVDTSDDHSAWIPHQNHIEIRFLDIKPLWDDFYNQFGAKIPLPTNPKCWEIDNPLPDGTYYEVNEPSNLISPEFEKRRMQTGIEYTLRTLIDYISHIPDEYQKKDVNSILNSAKKAIYAQLNSSCSIKEKLTLWEEVNCKEEKYKANYKKKSPFTTQKAALQVMFYTNQLMYKDAKLDEVGFGSMKDIENAALLLLENIDATDYFTYYATTSELDQLLWHAISAQRRMKTTSYLSSDG